MRIDSRINVHTPATTLHSGGASGSSVIQKPVNEQVQTSLFGYRPSLFDASQASAEAQAELARLLRLLTSYRTKLDAWAQEPAGRPIVLAQNTIAAIDADGTIYFDASFLLQHASELDLLVGILAHEVGHRPQYWSRLKPQVGTTPQQLDEICRFEEIRADTFAGQAIAELQMSVEPMIDLLKHVQVEPHPRYLSAEQRGEVLRQAHRDGANRAADVKKFYPQMDRATSLRNIIGAY